MLDHMDDLRSGIKLARHSLGLLRAPKFYDLATRPTDCDNLVHRTRRVGHMTQSRYIVHAAARRGSIAERRLISGATAIIVILAKLTISAAATESEFAVERAAMVRTIAAYAAEVSSAIGRDRIAPEVLNAMRIVPRHEFVPDSVRHEAYADRPLPIGYGQTISQPFIVALMTDLLQVGPNDVVLEVGTGSGYQAAVLARIVRKVYTIEIVPALAEAAEQRLQRLGNDNVTTRHGDGYYGWEETAPFDGIIVTAAVSQIPPPLIAQVKPGRRMVVPVGTAFALQYLVLVEVDNDKRVTTRQLLPVRFVPLTGRN
jgi:protein-L-isoaspartate(D-aspartate) O-methyltransferase